MGMSCGRVGGSFLQVGRRDERSTGWMPAAECAFNGGRRRCKIKSSVSVGESTPGGENRWERRAWSGAWFHGAPEGAGAAHGGWEGLWRCSAMR
jgi:hypothetical protein